MCTSGNEDLVGILLASETISKIEIPNSSCCSCVQNPERRARYQADLDGSKKLNKLTLRQHRDQASAWFIPASQESGDSCGWLSLSGLPARDTGRNLRLEVKFCSPITIQPASKGEE